MPRPVVIVSPDAELASVLGRDLRYPAVSEAAHVEVLVAQGFSCIAACSIDGEIEAELIELEDGLDVGVAHQRIWAAGHDLLKLNADVGVFAWTSDGAGRVLMVKQAYGRSLWMLPGGELHLQEAPDKAVAREAKEETGYEVEVERLIAVYGRQQHIGLYFACRAVGGEERTDFDTEVADVGWFDPAEPPAPPSPVIGLLRTDLAAGQVAARFF